MQRKTAAAAAGKLPGVLVVHEKRGLSPHIEDIARRLALDNFLAFAPDAPYKKRAGRTTPAPREADDLRLTRSSPG